jgi:hypothetical protein
MGALIFSQRVAAFMTFSILFRQKTSVEHRAALHRESSEQLDHFTAPGKKR